MKALGVGLAGFALAAAAVAVVATAGQAAATAPRWSSARLMPGVGGDWSVPTAISCTGPGYCTAGGEYGGYEPYTQSMPFVASETKGAWGKAVTVPGINAFGGQQYAAVTDVSCAWQANCAAIGYYLTSQDTFTGQAFVADEIGGTWRKAQPLTGITNAVNVSGLGVGWNLTVSCAPQRTAAARTALGLACEAGGATITGTGTTAFVATSTRGTWHAATPVTGLSALAGTRASAVTAISCPAAGTCAIGGDYTDAARRVQAFVANEVNGTWRRAIEVPGTAVLNAGGNAQVTSLDCPAAGDCTAAGQYTARGGTGEVFVINAAGNAWRRAVQLPGSARLGQGGAGIAEVSCASITSCAVGGTVWTARQSTSHGVIGTETSGKWGSLAEVSGADTSVTTLSCPVAGDCAAGGYSVNPVADSVDAGNGIVVDQVSGKWGKPVTVAPGGPIVAEITALSCAAVRNCESVGYLPDGWEGGPWAAFATEG
jgi:hypothetical protein